MNSGTRVTSDVVCKAARVPKNTVRGGKMISVGEDEGRGWWRRNNPSNVKAHQS